MRAMKDKKGALEEMLMLFSKARVAKDSAVAKRFVRKARRLAMKFRIRLPPALKKQFCKQCNAVFVHGTNVRIRTTGGKVVYTCLECRNFMRFKYR